MPFEGARDLDMAEPLRIERLAVSNAIDQPRRRRRVDAWAYIKAGAGVLIIAGLTLAALVVL